MADPKNPGYRLELEPTADPDVIRVLETDDTNGPALVRTVSAAAAASLVAASKARHPTARKTTYKKPAAAKPAVKPVKKAAKKK